jgi:hypothetical protein
VVAGIEIAVVFEGEGAAAGFGEDAHGGRGADPVAERGVEELDVDTSDVVPDPFVEDGGEERAVVLRFDASTGEGASSVPSWICGGAARSR